MLGFYLVSVTARLAFLWLANETKIIEKFRNKTNLLSSAKILIFQVTKYGTLILAKLAPTLLRALNSEFFKAVNLG